MASSWTFTSVWVHETTMNTLLSCEDLTNRCAVFQYASDIEVNSPRFSGPGDFVTYVIFVAIFILVSGHSFLASREGYKHGLYPILSSLFAKHLLNLPAQPILAVAVPEFEGDYPCTSCIPIIRIISILQGMHAV